MNCPICRHGLSAESLCVHVKYAEFRKDGSVKVIEFHPLTPTQWTFPSDVTRTIEPDPRKGWEVWCGPNSSGAVRHVRPGEYGTWTINLAA